MTYAEEPNPILPIISDGQFVYGPNVDGFELKRFLENKNSVLSEEQYLTVIDDLATYYSINPKVLLTIIEMQSGLVTKSEYAQEDLKDPIGYKDINGFTPEMQKITSTLFNSFYERYNKAGVQTSLILADGSVISIPDNINAGSFAIFMSFAELMDEQSWIKAIDKNSPHSFWQTYTSLFPGENLLDDSNILVPNATPPSDLLKLPYPCNDTWKFFQGPHPWNGSNYCNTEPHSSLDFGPGNSCSSPIPSNEWITAAASGSVTVKCNGCMIVIDHGNGWETRYYHVANPSVSSGDTVNKDDRLGHPSCRPTYGESCGSCGGSASGSQHVHFAINLNGAYQSIDGTSLEGWIVHDTGCYEGYLKKGSTIVYDDGGTVKSTECPDQIPPTVSATLSGTEGENSWFLSQVTVTISATDNNGGSGVKKIDYKIDDGNWQSHNGSTVSFTISNEGKHTIWYKAQDNAGNWSSEESTDVNIDLTPPNGSIILNHNLATTHTVLTPVETSGGDATSGVAWMRMRNYGDNWEDWQSFSVQTYWQLPATTDQDYVVEMQVKDVAGNISDIYQDNITLDIYPERPHSTNYRLSKSTVGASAQNGNSTQYQLQGTLGQPSTGGDIESSNYHLVSGYWANLPCTTVAFTSSPTITIEGDDITLGWAAVTGATGYNIYRDTTPYFTPDNPYANTNNTTWTDTGVVGDHTINYYYIVLPINSCGVDNTIFRIGEFDFKLIPGQ